MGLVYDMVTRQWTHTNLEDVERYRLPDITPSASVVVDGQSYLFGNGRCCRFNRQKSVFEEIGFRGVTDRVWDVHDVIYVAGQRRIYIFGITDRPHSCHRTWHDEIYYLNVDAVSCSWTRFNQNMPYRTVGAFADYSAVLGYGHLLFLLYHKVQELWIFDLSFGRAFKCRRPITIESADYGKVLLTKENILHCLCVDGNGPIHTKLAVHEFLIEELIRYRNKLQADLV